MMENLCELWNNFCSEGVQLEEQRTKIFKIQPVSPKVFFKEWLPPSLSDEQLKAVDSIFEITEEGLEWNKNYMEYLLFWGEGCLTGEDKIKCVKTGKKNTVSYWSKSKVKPYIESYNHKEGRIEIKPIEYIENVGVKGVYEVVLNNGKKIRVSESHIFYIEGTYTSLKDLRDEDKIACISDKKNRIIEFVKIESINYVGKEECFDLSVKDNENYFLHTMLHHNGGKDFTCSRILLYCAYWLMCMNSPQKYFGIAENEPIDIINVSINATHAKNVFFHKFSTAVQRVINPKTGVNWFTEQGMDLREGKDTQSTMIKFGNNVRAHSLHSEKYAGEGMNILLAVFDEVGEFKPQKAKELYEALWHTETSRYGNKFKIFLISYMRDVFDFMSHRWAQTKDKPEKIYRSNKATWEVNPLRKKEDFALAYEKNPEEASRRFENKNIAGSGNRFFKYQDRIRGYANKNRCSPIADNIMYTDNLINVPLHKWFLPHTPQELYTLQLTKRHLLTPEECRRITFLEAQHQHSKYYIHIDLAKANPDVGQDCAGFAMAHSYILNPLDEESGRGVYLDLAIQLRSQQELNFETIRTFIYKLQDKGFEIGKVTLDGYQSLDTTQLLKAKGIDSEVLSIDRTMEPYNTLKELIYTKKLDYYSYIILMRELEELINEKGKVDHPEISNRRANEEGIDRGSKDVADATAGATFMALKEAPNTSAWFSVF